MQGVKWENYIQEQSKLWPVLDPRSRPMALWGMTLLTMGLLFGKVWVSMHILLN